MTTAPGSAIGRDQRQHRRKAHENPCSRQYYHSRLQHRQVRIVFGGAEGSGIGSEHGRAYAHYGHTRSDEDVNDHNKEQFDFLVEIRVAVDFPVRKAKQGVGGMLALFCFREFPGCIPGVVLSG